MPIMDRSIGWKYRTKWLPANTFMGLDNDGSADTSLSQGTPTVETCSGTAELACIPMTTADEIHTLITIPWDMNRDEPVLARIVFAHASTDADADVDWKIGVVPLAKQEGLTELATIAAAGTNGALVAVDVHTCSTTDDSIEVTPWTDTTLDTIMTSLDIMLGLVVELDDDGATTGDECEFLGLELLYEVQMTHPTDSVRHRSKHGKADNPLNPIA